jgi:H+/Cl- antiporter ClcA
VKKIHRLIAPSIVGLGAGLSSAFFLWSLAAVTQLREQHPALLWGLPLFGLIMGTLYEHFGLGSHRGTNLTLDEIHEPRADLPVRMAPLVFFGTLLTHLGGGSAGREGTAVQMGAALAEGVRKTLKIPRADRSHLLMAGMSGGFAAVFGVPIAGWIFGLEVLWVKHLDRRAILECGIAALVGHAVCIGLGATHTIYPSYDWSMPTLITLAAILTIGVLSGIAARLFSELTHKFQKFFEHIRHRGLRAFVAGLLLAILFQSVLFARYQGLGLNLIRESFESLTLPWDSLAKMFFTAVTVGSGFTGGEVTPLFSVGTTLGNTLQHFLFPQVDLTLMVGLALVSVFAGAARTPLACSLMAAELFGWPILPYALLSCFLSHWSAGRTGIYPAQRQSPTHPH